MVTFVQGDIFSSPAQVLTNPVNTVGVMGKGLALEFKTRFPDMFADYNQRCAEGKVHHGQPYLWENERVQILNFRTKRHWKDPSRLEDIEAGLAHLAAHYQDMGIYSIALPALGAGHGGLNWSEVRPLIEKHLASIPDLEVFVYETGVAVVRDDSTTSKTEVIVPDSGDFAAQEI